MKSEQGHEKLAHSRLAAGQGRGQGAGEVGRAFLAKSLNLAFDLDFGPESMTKQHVTQHIQHTKATRGSLQLQGVDLLSR